METIHTSGSVRPIRVAVWCLYEGIVKDGYLFKNRDAGLGADLLKVWCDLYEYGKSHGFDFLTFDQVDNWDHMDAIILCDRPLPGNPLVDAAMQSRAAKYLITSECPIIYQPSWEPEYHRRFQRVWTWDDSLVDGVFYLKSNSVTDPVLASDFRQQKAQFSERKLVTMIAGAKASQHPNELYSHRVRAIHWFESSAPEHFDLYGMGWNSEQFPSYRGAISHKLDVLARYRFCLCYENAQGLPGYITEKMLDCLRVGTVPVYGGAPNVEKWIPSDCFISINQFNNYFELFDYLNGMDQDTYAGYLDRIERFVTGPGFYPFSIDCMVQGITRTLDWDLRQAKAPNAVLVQNPVSLQMEIKTADVPLVVWMPYDNDSPVQQRLRGLWQFFSSYFPEVQFHFVRCARELGPGEIKDNGTDLLVGAGSGMDRAVHDVLLRRYRMHFHLLKASMHDVFDPQAFHLQCARLGAGVDCKTPLGRLAGRDTLEAERHQRRVDGSGISSNAQATEWVGNVSLDHVHSDDPLVLLEQMERILRSLQA